MCVLIALFQVVDGAPLVVGANRDEVLARPAVAMTVLRDAGPRILGGRDELAGGTWLAVNEHGVVAGLTNQAAPAGRDAGKRSRGELPLAFAAHKTAAAAIEAVVPGLDPAAYNPCWMLVGDRDELFSVGLTGGTRKPEVERLGPGTHVLQNAPFRAPAPKTAAVSAHAEARLAAAASPAAAQDALAAVLCDHTPAPGFQPGRRPDGRPIPPEVSAACVHIADYGTRSSMIIMVPPEGRPRVRVADGPPCQAALQDVTGLWARVPAG